MDWIDQVYGNTGQLLGYVIPKKYDPEKKLKTDYLECPCRTYVSLNVSMVKNKPEEVFATKKLAVEGEALVAQETATVGALHACVVPRPVEHVQQELVNDRQLAPGTHYHHCYDFRSESGKQTITHYIVDDKSPATDVVLL